MNNNIIPFKKKKPPKTANKPKDGLDEIVNKIKLIRKIVRHADTILVDAAKHDFSRMREGLDSIHESFGSVVKLVPAAAQDLSYTTLLRWMLESTSSDLHLYQNERSIRELNTYIVETQTFRDVCTVVRNLIDDYVMIAMAYGQLNDRRVNEKELQIFHDEVGREVFNFPKALQYFQDRTEQIQEIVEHFRFGVLCETAADKYRLSEN